MQVVFLAEARAEALDAFQWYEDQRAGLGVVFRAALDDAIKRVRLAPFTYPIQYRDLRRTIVYRFPYGVFYRIVADTVVVVGVIHARRHPREWRRRK